MVAKKPPSVSLGWCPKSADTITVDMNDTMRYTPADVSVGSRKTIRFIVKNSGQVKHEMSLGTEKELLGTPGGDEKVPGHGARRTRQGGAWLRANKVKSSAVHLKAGTVNFARLMPGTF